MTVVKSKTPSTIVATLQRNPKPSFQGIIGLVLLGLLLPLLTIEVMAYLFPSSIPREVRSVFLPEQDQPLKGLTPDVTLGYKYAPGLIDFAVPFDGDAGPDHYSVSTVSLGYPDAGFRDDGLAAESFAVVIGDSYTSCASVTMEACWVERLEQQTDQDWANLGVVGYSPQQEERMLDRYGLPLQPKLVAWVFFANDLNDAWRFDQFGSGAAQEGQFWRNPVLGWLAHHSTVYNLGAFFWYNRALFYNLATFNDKTIPRDSNLVWWLTYTDLNISEVADGLALTQQAILNARQQILAQDEKTKFVVVIFPYREQVYISTGLQPQLDQLNQALADFCRQQQLTCLDLTSVLRERAKQDNEWLYFRKDIHLNAHGNEVVANILSEALKDYWILEVGD